MTAPVVRNSYRFPGGWSAYFGSAASKYKTWNGFLGGASPARALVGASQTYNIASVPADLSTLILNTPDGRSFTFQFVYNASVQTTGIKVPLPLSGASTAAQVQTAMLAVLGAAGGIPLGGNFVSFPWVYQQTGAAQFSISYTVAGFGVGAGGTQVTITLGAITVPFFGFGSVVPARIGSKIYGWLRG